jgi:5-methylcytosine-specific restriction endonuclease McrA
MFFFCASVYEKANNTREMEVCPRCRRAKKGEDEKRQTKKMRRFPPAFYARNEKKKNISFPLIVL